MSDSPRSLAGPGFAFAHLILAGLLLFSVFGLLPGRWWVVDVPAGLIGLLLVGSAIGFIRRDPLGLKVARVATWVVLLFGAVTFAALCYAAAFAAGVQGVLGKGVAIAYALALVLPVGTYFVLLPVIELRWLKRQRLKQQRAS
ncbi:MAG: hypothetical protein ACI9U2_003191 [Bradymonadia bacterium]|jgi:hypothetical protein